MNPSESDPKICRICHEPLDLAEQLRGFAWHPRCGDDAKLGNCSPNNPKCEICNLALSDGEFHLNRSWHYDCEICQICHDEFPNPGRIRECLDKQIPVSHITCYNKSEIEKIRTHVVPTTQSMLAAVNDQILTLRHTVAPPASDIQLLQGFLRTLEETATNVAWLLDQTRDKIRIDTNVAYEETAKRETRNKRETQAKQQIKEQQTAERSAMLTAERNDESGRLRAKRKAIEGLITGLGITREQAEEIHQAALRRSAENPGSAGN